MGEFELRRVKDGGRDKGQVIRVLNTGNLNGTILGPTRRQEILV